MIPISRRKATTLIAGQTKIIMPNNIAAIPRQTKALQTPVNTFFQTACNYLLLDFIFPIKIELIYIDIGIYSKKFSIKFYF